MTPPKSPNPRAKKAPRGSRAAGAAAGAAAGPPVSAKKLPRSAKPKKSKKRSTTRKSLREAAREALEALETSADRPRVSPPARAAAAPETPPETIVRGSEGDETDDARTSAVAKENVEKVAKENVEKVAKETHAPPNRSGSPPNATQTPAAGHAARPAWDGRPYNPRASVVAARRGATNGGDATRSVAVGCDPSRARAFATARVVVTASDAARTSATHGTNGTSGTCALSSERRKGALRRGSAARDAATADKKNAAVPGSPSVARLTLNISGDASVAQKVLTRAREEEKATKAAAAATARATARARVLSARARVEETCGRASRAPATFEASSLEASSSPAAHGRPSRSTASRPRTPLGACASAYASERQRAQECLSRRGRFSDALVAKRRDAAARRPTMAYGELCPLNAAREKAAFLSAYERYERKETTSLPPDPVFEYADPEAARVAMRRWGLPRDEFLAHAERVIARRAALFPPRKTEDNALAAPRKTEDDALGARVALETRDEPDPPSGSVRERQPRQPELDREDPEIDEDEDDADSFARAAWGERVDAQALEEEARRYLARHDIADVVALRWHDGLSTPSMTTTTTRDPHTGVSVAKGVLHLPRSAADDGADDGADAKRSKKFYRKRWIAALLDHEIGTHFAIAANDAAQGEALRDAGAAFGGGQGCIDDARSHLSANGFPAHKAKSRGFGVAGAATPRERLVTEEGLATLNTHRCAGVKILYGPALAYWTRWHASRLSFSELFLKLEEHVPSVNARWTQCVRSKRGLVETSQKKACAKDQCYFEGAVRLLEARRLLDFKLLHGGKIALEEYADAKQAMLRHSQRRGKIARRLRTPSSASTLAGAIEKGETASRPASALRVSRRDFDLADPDLADPELPLPDARAPALEKNGSSDASAPNYLRGIRGGVSSASLVDAVASALRSQTLMDTAASRAFEPHFLADEARYLAELDALAEANGVEAKDDVATRAIAGWAPRRAWNDRLSGRRAANEKEPSADALPATRLRDDDSEPGSDGGDEA